jgi:O-antigen/teichoic acid export membrane protein
VARLAGCGTGLILAFNGYGPWSLIAQSLVAGILGAAALWFWSPRVLRRMPRVGPLIGYIATSVGLPVFARIQHDPHRLAQQFLAATSTLCIIALPSFAGLAICARTIVEAVLGEAWLPSVPLMQTLALGAGAGFTAIFSYTAFSALGRPARALPLSVFELALSIGLLFAVSDMGILAASLAWSLRQIFSAIVLLTMCTRVLPLRPLKIAQALAQPAMLTLLFSAVLWSLDHVILLRLGPVVRLSVLAPAAGVILIMGVALIRPDLIRVVMAQVRVPLASRPNGGRANTIIPGRVDLDPLLCRHGRATRRPSVPDQVSNK